jgi:hypothetical protein
MVAGPGAAYICDACLQLCEEIMNDAAPFSEKALELASRPPVVIAAPPEIEARTGALPREPVRTITVELEQKEQGMVLMLRELQMFPQHFELHYLWMRHPLTAGFAFMPRIIFSVQDDTGKVWHGDSGGLLIARPELASSPELAVYQGSARFRPLPSNDARKLLVKAADPLGQFGEPPLKPWHFEITLAM